MFVVDAVLNFSYTDFGAKVSVNLIGPFHQYSNASTDFISINVLSSSFNTSNEALLFSINETISEPQSVSFDIFPETLGNSINFSLFLESFAERAFAFQLSIDSRSVDYEAGIISAFVILIFLNILIATEV